MTHRPKTLAAASALVYRIADQLVRDGMTTQAESSVLAHRAMLWLRGPGYAEIGLHSIRLG